MLNGLFFHYYKNADTRPQIHHYHHHPLPAPPPQSVFSFFNVGGPILISSTTFIRT